MEKSDTWQALWEMLKAQPGDDPTTVEVSLDGMRRVADALSNNGWRDISTAPRDGTRILGFGLWAGEINGPIGPALTAVIRWDGGHTDYPGYTWSVENTDGYSAWMNPTHWQPLPQPPGGSE